MDPAIVETVDLHTQVSADHIWVLLATALVLFMQVGFLFLEAGVTRSKNAISVAQKNLGDFCLSVATFYAIGFSVMFGASQGWIGWSPELAFFDSPSAWVLAFFGFQAVFAGTAATIMSGAVAERMRITAYLVCVVALAGFLYPMFGHWAWGNLLDADNPAWLADAGFLDFAGSTVVHSAGAWFALGVIIVLGARTGRFSEDGKPVEFHGHSLVLSAAGCMILLFGWFGFNAGSTVAATSDVALILANTLVAAVFGGLAGKVTGRILFKKMTPLHIINGTLGGLVGITAGCAFVGVAGAAQIGLICGVAVILSEYLMLHKLKLDDVVGAISVHGTCGAIGTLLVALYAAPEMLALDSRMAQFAVQAQGVALAFALFGGSGWLTAQGLALCGKLRVSENDEMRGLNIAEHGVQMGTGALQDALTRITLVERDLTQRLDMTGGDDASEMAQIINPFLTEMQETLRNLSRHSDEVYRQASALEEVSVSGILTRSKLSQSSHSLVAAATELEAGAEATQKTVGAVRDKAEGLAAASSALRQDMAAMTETAQDMSLAINMVVENTQTTSASSGQAKTTAQEGYDRVSHLQSVIQQVEEVVNHISEIADKTLLLALNARVEAARSGETGSGFAVVAQEVAELSKQTHAAAEQINHNLAEMQIGGQDALSSMTSVKTALENLEAQMGTILQSTQTQASALTEFETLANAGNKVARKVEAGSEDMLSETEEIAEFAQRVKSGSQTTRSLAESVAQSAKDSGTVSETLRSTSEQLSSGSISLKTASGRFKA